MDISTASTSRAYEIPSSDVIILEGHTSEVWACSSICFSSFFCVSSAVIYAHFPFFLVGPYNWVKPYNTSAISISSSSGFEDNDFDGPCNWVKPYNTSAISISSSSGFEDNDFDGPCNWVKPYNTSAISISSSSGFEDNDFDDEIGTNEIKVANDDGGAVRAGHFLLSRKNLRKWNGQGVVA
ncbi:hypothetical protein LOK49_LG15G02017 [Camellia lanceoleosa]|uniref:Uncharacterized protein n=1 Tax=Camellia lanceoleosa TaxID=1840588 RepID=A0ACC0F7R4_9ERIC|nr:hypothetical protein LOK49_LG15G02017 [Camellia lanceoleosa]